MKPLFILATLILATPAHADDVARSWQQFYASEAHFGQLGVVRSDQPGHIAISALPVRGEISIPARGDTHFVFNHFKADAPSDDDATSYVAVLVFLAYPKDLQAPKPALVVHRNPGWWREYCPARRPSCFNAAREQHQFYDAELPEKARTDHLQGDETVLDRDLDRKFDGYPVPNHSLDSWNDRQFWKIAPRDDAICRNPAVRCEVEYHLIKFAPTSLSTSASPVDFTANTWYVTAASIYAFSPNQDAFNAHYAVRFTQ